MSPLVGWPSVLGLITFAAGLYMYRGDLWAPGVPGRSRMLALAPVFIAVGDTEEERARLRDAARQQLAFYASTPTYELSLIHISEPTRH